MQANLLDQLMHSPQLPLYIEQLQKALATEREKRKEFYEKVTEQDKAEFINGEIVVHSPVKLVHNVITKLLLKLLDTFVEKQQLGLVAHEKLLISLTRNDYEPDLCFFATAKSQKFTPQQTRFPAPDLVVEVLSPSTAAVDRGIKFEDYAAHGIQEYWIIEPETAVVEQYLLQGDSYELHVKSDSGVVKSIAIPGLTIPIRAIFDQIENLKVLKEMLT